MIFWFYLCAMLLLFAGMAWIAEKWDRYSEQAAADPSSEDAQAPEGTVI